MMNEPRERAAEPDSKAEFENDVLSQYDYQDDTDNEIEDEIEDVTSDIEETETEDFNEEEDTEPDQSDANDQEETETRTESTEESNNFKLKSDSKGNLVDGSGKIVARAGSERRLFEKAHKYQNAYNQLDQEFAQHQQIMRQAHDEIVRLRQENEYFKQGGLERELNITPDEKQEALTIYNKFKNDATALDAAKYVLTKLAQRGINIQSLGVGSGAIDPSIITQGLTQHIDQRLNPITQRFQAEEQQKQAREQANQVITQFFSTNPDAKPHRETLGRILKDPRFKGMSLSEAWSRLQNHLLRQQLEQRQTQQSQAPEPRPTGRPRPSPSGPRQSVDDSPMNADMDYKDIVRSVFNDYGRID